MSPRPWEQDSSTKKKEMVSYKILGLGREIGWIVEETLGGCLGREEAAVGRKGREDRKG